MTQALAQESKERTERVLSATDVASMLRISASRVHQLEWDGLLPSHRFGRTRLCFLQSEVEAFLKTEFGQQYGEARTHYAGRKQHAQANAQEP